MVIAFLFKILFLIKKYIYILLKERENNIDNNIHDSFKIALKDSEFKLFAKLVYQKVGINIQPHKKSLVENRLRKRIKALNLESFGKYYDYVVKENDSGKEIIELINAISTNVTHFFREKKHFDYMKETVLPQFIKEKKNDKKIRIWSAASSSGEEIYTILMTVNDFFKDKIAEWNYKILGTDISTEILQKAIAGQYLEKDIKNINPGFVSKYFLKTISSNVPIYTIKDTYKQHVLFRRLNLIDNEFPLKKPLDIIFCRNVMIYFDKPTQEKIVNRFYKHLAPGGYLFIGHSEGLSGVNHGFKYLMPSIFRKI